jgi:hypothetical protein
MNVLKDWTIEEHGKGWALYSGRGIPCFSDIPGVGIACGSHGMNLVYLTEPDRNFPEVKKLIEGAPELLQALYATHRSLLENPDYLKSKQGQDNAKLLAGLSDCLAKQGVKP